MKSKFRMLLAAITFFAALALLFAALALPLRLAAQDKQDHNRRHHHYRLVDLGTFGGPNSSVPTGSFGINGSGGARAISNQGTVTGFADTSTADPLCYIDDCFFPNAFQWQNGALTNLGALPGSQWSAASWISGNGLIVGASENGETDPLTGLPEFRAVLWQAAQITDLSTLPGGFESLAWAINNRGRVVGFATNTILDPYSYFYFQFLGSSTGTQTRAFSWDNQNGMQDLGTLGGPDAWAGFVNERGQIAGISYTSSTANANNGACAPNTPTQDPFFWERDSGMIDVGTFGGTCGVPNALNNRGQVAGQSYLPGNLTAHAFLWDKRGHPQLRDLGTLGGDNASALWLNDAGDVVGYADLPPNPPGCTGLTCVHHGFLWKHGVMTDLGTIGTDPCSRALSINSKGQIVGASATVCGGALTHALLFENDGPAIDLNTLVPPGSALALTEAIYINDRGEIAGVGVLANGATHAFLLIPCDEEHANDEDCEEGGGANTVPQPIPAIRDASSRALPPSLLRGMSRYRFPGRAFGPKE
jgi:probable HAF family extracellular repeat protein